MMFDRADSHVETITGTGDRLVLATALFDGQPLDGMAGRKVLLAAPHAVAVLPMLPDQQVVLVGQYRPAIGWTVEAPAGKVDPDDADYLAAAQRELREETGLTGGVWRSAGSILPSPGSSTEEIHLFVAHTFDADWKHPPPDDPFGPHPVVVDAAAVWDQIRAGEQVDAKTSALMAWALANGVLWP